MAKARAAVAIVSAALLVGGGLSGCSGNTDFPILDRAQTSDDVLPDSVTDTLELDEYDVASSRLSATHDGVQYFVIERTTGPGLPQTCILVASDDPVIACGGTGLVEVSAQGMDDAQLVPAVARDGGGWTAISDNVRIRGARG